MNATSHKYLSSAYILLFTLFLAPFLFAAKEDVNITTFKFTPDIQKYPLGAPTQK